MSEAPVRREALRILMVVAQEAVLDRELGAGRNRLDPRDHGLLSELVRGTLQWQGRYDHLITHFARHRPPRDARLRTILRLALHQLLALDGVPAYAAIHQAGEQCRRLVGARQVGFVNGLLQAVRRAVAGTAESTAAGDGREQLLAPFFSALTPGSTAWTAAWHSHPQWLVERWVRAYGAEAATAICAWNNRPVPIVLHVIAPADPPELARALAQEGWLTNPGPGARALTLTSHGSRAELGRLLGRFPQLIVQDGAVQAATAWLAGDGLSALAPSGPMLDLCAAPGGKTAHLSGVWPGRIVAMDNRRDRVHLLAGTVKRIEREGVDVVLADGRRPPLRPNRCAAVLLDGPCSGTGVLRHHPEARWRLRPELPGRRGEHLLALAHAACDLLVPGGRLLYATCSLEAEENEDVIGRLLAERADLATTPDPTGAWRRTWLPGPALGDGFFAARLTRVGP